MAKQGFTTADFILYGKVGNAVANQTIVETIGYNSAGDGGIGRWQFTGLTGQTPSQSPADLLDGCLNDAGGKQWTLVDQFGGTNLKALGLIADGVTSDSSILSAMIAYKTRIGGGDFYADAGVIAIDQLFNIPSPAIRFFGAGHNCNLFALADKGTILKWVGAVSTGYMLSVRTQDSLAAKKVGGVTVKGICLDGGGLCARGVNYRTVDNCQLLDIGIQQVTEWGIYTDTNINPPGTEALDNQHNYFNSIAINLTGMANAGGVKLTANPLSPISNTSMNEVHNLSIRIEDGDALHFGNADSNTIQHFRVFREIAKTGNAVVYDEQVADPGVGLNRMYARTNVIYHMHSAQAGVVVNDNPASFRPAVDNVIYGWNLDGNAPNVVVTRTSEKGLKIISARSSELPNANGISYASTDFADNNAKSEDAIEARDTLGLAANPAVFKYKDNSDAYHEVIADHLGNAFGVLINETTGNLVIDRIAGTGIIEFGEQLQLQGQTTATSATAGAGTALPATPQAYLQVVINGVERKIPFYPL